MVYSTKDSLQYYCPSQKKWREVELDVKSIPELAKHYGLVLYRYEHTRLKKYVYHIVKETPGGNTELDSLRLGNGLQVEALIKWVRNSTIEKRKDDLTINELLNKLIDV